MLFYLRAIKNLPFKSFFESKLFLYYSCGIVFILNLYINSVADIGPDSAVYINFGKKIAEGGRYYFDYFESNLPFNFYPYALFYIVSQKTGINNIIIVQIAFYLMFFTSIYCSSRIIKKTTISDNKLLVNFLFLSFFIGFLLRTPSMRFNEIGTKSSFLMMTLIPYLLYSFEHKSELSRIDKIIKGLLMALIPCFKPHYLIIVITIEIFRIYQKKLFLKLFDQLDYLCMVMFGLIALNWLIYFESEYIEFMVPMWRKVYSVYNNIELLLNKILFCMINVIIPSFGTLILVFRYQKVDYNLKLLIFAQIGSAITLLSEGLLSDDQVSVYFFVNILSLFYIISNKEFFKLMNFGQRKFILFSLISASFFGVSVVISILFGINSVLFSFWVICPFVIALLYHQKIISIRRLIILILTYFFLLSIPISISLLNRYSVYSLSLFIALNLILIIISVIYYEIKFQSKSYNYISNFSFVIVLGSILLINGYFFWSCGHSMNFNDPQRSPNNNSDLLAYYIKKYAPNNNDKAIFISKNIPKYPIYNYLGKYNESRLLSFFYPSYKNNEERYEQETLDIQVYVANDMSKAINNKDYKIIIFVDNVVPEETYNSCSKDVFEVLMNNHDFKKVFLKNFRFVADYFSTYVPSSSFEKKIKIQNQFFSYNSKKNINNHIIVYVRKEN